MLPSPLHSQISIVVSVNNQWSIVVATLRCRFQTVALGLTGSEPAGALSVPLCIPSAPPDPWGERGRERENDRQHQGTSVHSLGAFRSIGRESARRHECEHILKNKELTAQRCSCIVCIEEKMPSWKEQFLFEINSHLNPICYFVPRNLHNRNLIHSFRPMFFHCYRR